MTYKKLLCIVITVILLSTGGLASAQSVMSIVNQVSTTSYTHYLNDMLYTHNGDNRGIGGAQHDLARTNIYNQFTSCGLTTSLDPFTYGGNTYNNVVGVHLGTTNPSQIYVVGAHYDSVGTPGADDNASGVAGVMEAARVLSTYDFEATVVFIAFDREEQGMIGSSAYVNEHRSDDIRGMVSMDMIAHNIGNVANIFGRTDPIKQSLAGALSLYGGLTPQLNGALDASDHAPFEWAGFDAALLIENGFWGSNNYYHTPLDSVDTTGYIDYGYATNMTRSMVGFLATAASPSTVPEMSTFVDVVTILAPAGVFFRRRRA